MGTLGMIFDIKQFAVFDGPGIRTTVFFKGCPLRCRWCHNPEGISFAPQLMVSKNSCIRCEKCREVCSHPERCIHCGNCVEVCPLRLRKICGKQYSAEELAEILIKDKEFLQGNGGGITFSGGEPLAQHVFLFELIEKLDGVHTAIETSGYCAPEIFQRAVAEIDYIIMDLKLIDSTKHKFYTGADNERIIRNFNYLKTGPKPFVVRVPLIPGVNDTDENLKQTALLVKDSVNLVRVELLPYHKTAGAKYGMVGMTYEPAFNTEQKPKANTACFTELGIPYIVM